MRYLLFPFALLLAGPGHGQTTADTLRPLRPDRLLRYTYANDFLHRTDYYFTQGMTLTLVHPGLARLPSQRLLLRGPTGSTQHHGITLRYDGFTPLRIQDPFIRVGDRPYAAYLYASFFRVSNHRPRRQRLTSALEIGFIGPAAGGKQLQTAIHRATNNPEPRGWDFQIGTDALLGYRVAYERQLLAVANFVEAVGTAQASVGTLYTYAGTGAQLRVGLLQPYFDGPDVAGTGRRTWQLYAHTALEGRVVGYDATLQGGLFNSSNPYELPASAVRRGVVRRSTGLVLAHRGLSLAAGSTRVSPEVAGGRPHRWGHFAVTVAF